MVYYVAVVSQFPRGTIPSLLGGDGNIDCGDDSLHNAEVIMNDLGKEGEEVQDAGDITGDGEWVEVLLMIRAHPNGGGHQHAISFFLVLSCVSLLLLLTLNSVFFVHRLFLVQFVKLLRPRDLFHLLLSS